MKLLHEILRRIRQEFRSRRSYFESHTLTLCPERYQEFVGEYKALLEKYIALGPKTNQPVVYQSFMAFLHTL